MKKSLFLLPLFLFALAFHLSNVSADHVAGISCSHFNDAGTVPCESGKHFAGGSCLLDSAITAMIASCDTNPADSSDTGSAADLQNYSCSSNSCICAPTYTCSGCNLPAANPGTCAAGSTWDGCTSTCSAVPPQRLIKTSGQFVTEYTNEPVSSAGVWGNVTGGIGYSAGNVGIGTTAPLRPLQVGAIGGVGGIWVEDGGGWAGLGTAGDKGIAIYSTSTTGDIFAYNYASGGGPLTLNLNGPGGAVDVGADLRVQDEIYINSDNSNDDAVINFRDYGSGSYEYLSWDKYSYPGAGSGDDGFNFSDDVYMAGDLSVTDGVYTDSIQKESNATYVDVNDSLHLHDNSVNYVNQLHFDDNVRFYDDGNDYYLNFKWGHTTNGGIKFIDGDDNLQGYVYASGNNEDFGLLDSDGNWAVNIDRDTNTSLYVDNTERLKADTNGVTVYGSFWANGYVSLGDATTGDITATSLMTYNGISGGTVTAPVNTTGSVKGGSVGRFYLRDGNIYDPVTSDYWTHSSNANCDSGDRAIHCEPVISGTTYTGTDMDSDGCTVWCKDGGSPDWCQATVLCFSPNG